MGNFWRILSCHPADFVGGVGGADEARGGGRVGGVGRRRARGTRLLDWRGAEKPEK